MKKLMALLVVLLVFGGIVSAEVDAPTEEIAEHAESAINYFEKILHSSELDRVTINPNYGTDEQGDYIALVYMNYNDIHSSMPSVDKDVAVRVSDTIAMAIEYDCPEVVEMTVFWNFVEYNLTGKVTFTIDDDGSHFENAMFPNIMS